MLIAAQDRKYPERAHHSPHFPRFGLIRSDPLSLVALRTHLAGELALRMGFLLVKSTGLLLVGSMGLAARSRPGYCSLRTAIGGKEQVSILTCASN